MMGKKRFTFGASGRLPDLKNTHFRKSILNNTHHQFHHRNYDQSVPMSRNTIRIKTNKKKMSDNIISLIFR